MEALVHPLCRPLTVTVLSNSYLCRGCVTPRQIANLQEQVDGLDLDHDLAAIIDGYDEVPDWAQEKIKFALQNGHVPDEDWRGVRLNGAHALVALPADSCS